MSTPTVALIKEIALLRQKKARDESGLILVEGRHPIEEAIRAGLTLRHIFVLPTHPGHLPMEQYAQVPYQVDEKTMSRLCTTDSPPPCLAVFERPAAPQQFQGSLALVLDSIQDPGNLGTLIRSALAFGVEGIILTGDETGNTVEPYNPKVIRSSAGLVFAIPVFNANQAQLNVLLGESDWKIYATTGHSGALTYREADYTGRCAIVLGNEGRGVSENLFGTRKLAALTIPMAPAVESLNVAISGSVILAEAAARRVGQPITNAGAR
jgi:TrmH family RNA methyltransferase